MSEHSYVELAAEIVSAYVSNNPVPASGLPGLIVEVHAALGRITNGEKPVEPAGPLIPAVPLKKSVTDDYIICLEDGKKYKSLKRHIREEYGMTPDDYREKWGLADNYPMVAPNYAKTRSELAKKIGLGHHRGTVN